MDFPKPHPPKTIAQKLTEMNTPPAPVVKKPFIRKPHLTDRPFKDIKTQLEQTK